MTERQQLLPPVQFQQRAVWPSTSIAQGGSWTSPTSNYPTSLSSHSSAPSSAGPRTPPTPFTYDGTANQKQVGGLHIYNAGSTMNHGPAEMYYQQPPPSTMGSNGMGHPQQQMTLLQPGPGQYAPQGYPQYGYPNGLTSPPTASVPSSIGAHNVLPVPGQGGMPNQYNSGFDTTGQLAPQGMKPRVTATLWEDEGSLCFQVEARGICVARREDNHMINGTKLLNVAGMTRGRRDGILKSEKMRHVVKIGPMHLKGVWIPFERALDFANKEKITELLYPLFVHNIGALLCHPSNQTRGSQVMAAAEKRKQDQSQMRNGMPTGSLPSLGHGQQHHGMQLPGPPSALASHGRPGIDRAHTFPTPPTSASSVMGTMGASDNFQWSQPGMPASQPANNMTIDTGLSNARSMPNTPATTPPGPGLQSMQTYPPASQSFDGSRAYSAPSMQQSPYQTHETSPQDRSMYSNASSYVKTDMAPPSTRPSLGEQHDVKATNGYAAGHADSNTHDEEGDQEHEAEYTHDRGTYDANGTSYNYNAQTVNSMQGDHSQHMSPEMTASGGAQQVSGRSTPRSAAAPQGYYGQPGYGTPPRGQHQPNNMYTDRAVTNGASSGDVYNAGPDMNSSMPNGYASSGSHGVKRGRDDDEERPSSVGLDMKRRKTGMDAMPSPGYQATSATAASRRR